MLFKLQFSLYRVYIAWKVFSWWIHKVLRKYFLAGSAVFWVKRLKKLQRELLSTTMDRGPSDFTNVEERLLSFSSKFNLFKSYNNFSWNFLLKINKVHFQLSDSLTFESNVKKNVSREICIHWQITITPSVVNYQQRKVFGFYKTCWDKAIEYFCLQGKI